MTTEEFLLKNEYVVKNSKTSRDALVAQLRESGRLADVQNRAREVLGDEFTVFRAGSDDGQSFTLRRDVAEEFSRRHKTPVREFVATPEAVLFPGAHIDEELILDRSKIREVKEHIFAVGDLVEADEGRGTVISDQGDNVKLRLEPDGTLSKWIPKARVTKVEAAAAAPVPAAAPQTATSWEHDPNVAGYETFRQELAADNIPASGSDAVDLTIYAAEAIDKYPDYVRTLSDKELQQQLDVLPTAREETTRSGEPAITEDQRPLVDQLERRLEREQLRRAGQQDLPLNPVDTAVKNLRTAIEQQVRDELGAPPVAPQPGKAQTAPGEEAPGADREGGGRVGGQLPERGAGPPERGGARGQGPLGAVRPEPGEVTPGTRRRGGTGDRDTSGVVAEGVPDDAGAGADAVTASDPSGGTVPDRALAPTGNTRDPGANPGDYGLTPARIAGIIARGPAVRLRDNLAAIRIVKTLQAEHRYATHDEQDSLAKYVGWGDNALAQFLDDSSRHDWSGPQKATWRELQDLLTEAERKSLIRSSPNAHFTFDLYAPIWAVLDAAGFTGGRVLEPAIGTGHALGFMPPQTRHASTLTGVELDPFTATIAQALYPSARVQAIGYERARIPRGTQDLVLSNVPFGDFGVSDNRFPDFITARIHNYFFARALEHVRPGGLVVFVTSRYSMDGPNATRVRRYLMERAHFVGAVRLPNTAFDKTAKTEVVTDLIVLQRLQEGETARNAELFIESPKSEALSTTVQTGYGSRAKAVARNVYRSAWYDAHPDLILGTESLEGTMRAGGEYTVTATTEDLQGAIRTALATVLPPGSYEAATTQATQEATPTTAEGRFTVGEYRIGPKGEILRVSDRDGTLVDATPKRGEKLAQDTASRIRGMVGIRDALRTTVAAMRTDQPAATITQAQKALEKAYRAYVRKWGILNARVNKLAFEKDPDATNLLGLEHTQVVAVEKTVKGTTTISGEIRVKGLSDIFTTRTIHAEAEIDTADTPHDALLASLSSRAAIDWAYIARITGHPAATLQATLLGEGHVFEQPDGAWALRDAYLSGDVVTALADAEAAAETDPARFTRNVEALRAVQPKAKGVEDVGIAFGAHWVPAKVREQFLAEQVGIGPTDVTVQHDQTLTYSRWTVTWTREGSGKNHALSVPYGRDVGGQKPYVYSFAELVDDALNLRLPKLHWTEGSGDDRVTVTDPVGTEAARANLDELDKTWQDWVYSDPDRTERMLQIYNERLNRTVPRVFDGSHLANVVDWNPETKTGRRTTALPGLALPFPLHPHQLRGIWRALVSGNTLLAHDVGAGKTFEMIVIAMEMRRLGRARKPMITVPTYLLGQWREDIIKAYPQAKVLAFTEDDLDANKRQEAMARIAFGDWDIVLTPHSSFQLLSVSDERMVAMLDNMLAEIMAAEAEARARDGDDDPSVKQLERRRRQMEDKLNAKRDAIADKAGRSRNLTWEDLGVDALMVDEAQSFKNLYFHTNITGLRGLSTSEADKSLDMYIKVQDINEASGFRNLVFATATPVMNSLAEAFTMQRYLQPRRLDEAGLHHFDNWYAAFAKVQTQPEQLPDGSYRDVRRLQDFKNLRTLHQMFAEVMDYVPKADMPYLKLPKLEGGEVTLINTDQHPEYGVIKNWFTRRLDELRKNPPWYDHRQKVYHAPDRYHPITGLPIQGHHGGTAKDNVLVVMGDAALAAVDARLVLGHHVSDFPGSRLQVAAKEMADWYKKERAKKGVTLVFMDVGIPKSPPPLEFLGTIAAASSEGLEEAGLEDDVIDPEEVGPVADETAGFNLYDELKRALIARGVPSREIAYLHQARKPVERLALFQAARDGTVRFVFASTDKGGVGMSIQDRLGHMVEMDVPKHRRPGDVLQRIGRIIRQGNQYTTVRISRFVTKGTTDEYSYGLIAKKARGIEQFMRGEANTFTDDDPLNRSIEEAQILATGDPRGVELIKLRGDAQRLESQAVAQERSVAKARGEQQRAQNNVGYYRADLARFTEWLTTSFTPVQGDAFRMALGGTTYTDRKAANERLRAVGAEVLEGRDLTTPRQAGTLAGLPILVQYAEDRYGRGFVNYRLDATAADAGVTSALNVDRPGEDETFGQNANIVQSLTTRYTNLQGRAADLQRQIDHWAGEQAKADAQLARVAQSDLVERWRTATARVEELGAQLAAESARQAAVRDEIAKAPAAAPPSGEGQASVGGYTETEPMRTAGIPARPTTAHPLEFPELIELAGDIGVAIRVQRKFRKVGKTGEFRAGTIKLAADLFKAGNELQLAAVIAHEIGHAVDIIPRSLMKGRRANLLGRVLSLKKFMKETFTKPDGTEITNTAIKEELTRLSNLWRPWDPATESASFAAYRNSPAELYADAVSVLLRNPGMLQEEAPTFYQEFFDALDKKPEVERAYFDLQELLSGTREELIAHRLRRDQQMFERGDATALEIEARRRREQELTRKDLWFHLKHAIVSTNYRAVDRVNQLTKQGVVIPDDENPVYMLRELRYLPGKLKGFTERTFAPLYRGLAEADVPWNAFGQSLLYERVIAGDRSELGNPGGNSPADAQERYDALLKQFTQEQQQILRDGITTFRDAVKEVAETAWQAGLYTDDQHAMMMANPAYATFQVIEHLEKHVTSRIYQQVGTTKDITNPATATLVKTLVTIRALEYNLARKGMLDFLSKRFPDDIKPAKTQWRGRGMEPVESQDPKEKLVTYYEHGKRVGRYVDPYVAGMLDRVGVGTMRATEKIMDLVTGAPVFRPLFTSVNVGFQTANALRDFGRTWKAWGVVNPDASVLGSIPQILRRYRQAVPMARVRAFGLPEHPRPSHLEAQRNVIAAEEAGILSVTFNDLIQGDVGDTQIEHTLRKLNVAGFNLPKHAGVGRQFHAILQAIKEFGDFIETLPKAAAILEAAARYGSISQIPPSVRDDIRRKPGSPDFLERGAWTPITNRLFLFSNAIVQAWTADYETAREPRTKAGFWFKTALVNFLPKVLLFAGILGLGGVVLRRYLEKVSEYDRTNFLVVPIPLSEDASGEIWYLRLPQDDTGRFLGGLFWKALQLARGEQGTLETVSQVLDYTAGQLPSISPVPQAVIATGQMIAGQNPRDWFRGGNVLTEEEAKAGGWIAWKKFLGWEFQQLGGGIVWKFYPGDVQPRRKSVGQVLLELPVASNIIGRFIRKTNYGEVEALRAASRRAESTEATRRETEKSAVYAKVRDYLDLEPAQRTAARTQELALAIAVDLYKGDPMLGAKRLPQIEERLRKSIARGEATPLLDALLSAGSAEQRLAIVQEWERKFARPAPTR